MTPAKSPHIADATDAELSDRLGALQARYDPRNDGGGYPLPQLDELHAIADEQIRRKARGGKRPGAGRKRTLGTVACPKCGVEFAVSTLPKHVKGCKGESKP